MRISALQSESGMASIAQLDYVELIAELFGFDLETENGRSYLAYLKKILVQQLSPEVTGIITDPIYGFDGLSLTAASTGLALRLEALGRGNNRYQSPRILPDWGVDTVHNNYGVAKLEIYYHPAEEKSLEKKQLIAETQDFCHYEGIDLLLMIRLMGAEGGVVKDEEYEEVLLQSVSELAPNCQLLGVEYPGSALTAATLTAQLDVPWVIISHHVAEAESYDQFKVRVREVVESGAKGFVAGDVLWREIGQFRGQDLAPDWEKVEEFLETTARDRIIELRRISEEKLET